MLDVEMLETSLADVEDVYKNEAFDPLKQVRKMQNDLRSFSPS